MSPAAGLSLHQHSPTATQQADDGSDTAIKQGKAGQGRQTWSEVGWATKEQGGAGGHGARRRQLQIVVGGRDVVSASSDESSVSRAAMLQVNDVGTVPEPGL
uniref:DUF834 domain-containing protein n=1 Tax=Oryza meridionalis TaxID=40149 RepID=A0A0E0ETP9_9ORYZ